MRARQAGERLGWRMNNNQVIAMVTSESSQPRVFGHPLPAGEGRGEGEA